MEKEPMLVQKIDHQQNDHLRMVELVKQEIRDTGHLTGISELSSNVEQALLKVPRHRFVSGELAEFAYLNEALPIGCGQTISQPLIVALMTELIQPQKEHKVLEIGTGSGYQAAILAQLVKEVYTLEVIPELSLTAQRHFNECEYKNIYPLIGSGAEGWLEYAPYEGILVTAACETIPHALLDQLSPNGRMVIPLESQGKTQVLTLLIKDEHGHVHEKPILPVVFVPFT
jgi:protein-L-isoaspartate(D-aspartate) O-methyltransferase